MSGGVRSMAEPLITTKGIIVNLVQLTKALSPEERKDLLVAFAEHWCTHCGYDYTFFHELHRLQADGTMIHYRVPHCYCQADD